MILHSKAPCLGVVLLFLSIDLAGAADRVNASISWTPAQLSNLAFKRDDRNNQPGKS